MGHIKFAARGLLLALSFLTRLPLNYFIHNDIDSRLLSSSLVWYPLVGAVLSGVLLLAIALFDPFPVMLSSAMVISLWVVLTGALHLDGLADAMDAWFAGHRDSRQTLRVLQDPTVGVMGVVALVLVLLIKFAALCVLIGVSGVEACIGLMVALISSRTLALWLMLSTPYAKEEGFAKRLLLEVPRRACWFAIFVSVVLLLMVLVINVGFIQLIVHVFIMASFYWLWRSMWLQRIDGFTGDTVGAFIEYSETIALVLFAIAATGS